MMVGHSPKRNMTFASIDFETANFLRGSPCAVGIVIVDNGRITKRERWLMRPPKPADFFEDFNTSIHGITAKDVRKRPRFNRLLPNLLNIIGDRPIVAHNASFDLGVLREACNLSNIPWPELTYTCTMVISRSMLKLPSYKLPFCAEAMDISIDDHHDPLSDAEVAAELLLSLAHKAQINNLHDLLTNQYVCWGILRPGEWRGSTKKRTTSKYTKMDIPVRNQDADPDHFLYGELIVITGTLPGGKIRKEAWSDIANLGGIPQPNVTKKTTILVLADLNPNTLCPGSETSAKHRKALALQQKGQQIEIMDGWDFMAILYDGKGYI